MNRQLTVDDCIRIAERHEILRLALTQHDPGRHCDSPSGHCPCWADCEIAGRCLQGSEDE